MLKRVKSTLLFSPKCYENFIFKFSTQLESILIFKIIQLLINLQGAENVEI